MTNIKTNNDILKMLELDNNFNINTNTNNDILSTFSVESKKEDVFVDLMDEKSLNNNILLEINKISGKVQDIIINNGLLANNKDILLEIKNKLDEDDQKRNLQFKNILNNIYKYFLFFIKYILTSSFIFLILLSIINYNAYIEITRSYLNPDLLEQSKKSMIASVQQSSIDSNKVNEAKETKKEEKIEKIDIEKLKSENNIQKISLVKNKTYHSMEKLININENSLSMDIEIVPYENRIVIPKIGKNIPLIDVQNKTVNDVKELENIFLKELINGIVRYPGSAKPGEIGNSFIFGHSSNFPWLEGNYNDVFALIDNLVFGDEIIAYYGQEKYVYKIKEKKVIKPGDVSILKRNNNISEISLMTCWPVGTTLNRMIVIGELIK